MAAAVSRRNPSRSMVAIRPPTWSSASRTVTEKPASLSRNPAVNPAIPPPTTTARSFISLDTPRCSPDTDGVAKPRYGGARRSRAGAAEPPRITGSLEGHPPVDDPVLADDEVALRRAEEQQGRD